MRDDHKSEAYWSGLVASSQTATMEIEEFLQADNITYDVRLGELYSFQSYILDIASAIYSSGAPISKVISTVRHLLFEAYPAFVAVCRENPDYAVAIYNGGWDFRTRYLASAILSRLTPEESRPLVEALDFWPERDAIWERFIAALGHGEGRALRWWV